MKKMGPTITAWNFLPRVSPVHAGQGSCFGDPLGPSPTTYRPRAICEASTISRVILTAPLGNANIPRQWLDLCHWSPEAPAPVFSENNQSLQPAFPQASSCPPLAALTVPGPMNTSPTSLGCGLRLGTVFSFLSLAFLRELLGFWTALRVWEYKDQTHSSCHGALEGKGLLAKRAHVQCYTRGSAEEWAARSPGSTVRGWYACTCWWVWEHAGGRGAAAISARSAGGPRVLWRMCLC